MKKILILLCVLSNLSTSYGQKRVIVHDTIRISNNIKELELYKMLYQNAKDASTTNYSVLFTILAIVVAFMIFILGSQAFFNYRLNKRDLENLKSECQLLFSNGINKIQNEIQSIELKLAKDITDRTAETKQSYEKLHTSVTQRIDIMKSSVNELMAKNRQASGSLGAALIYQIGTCDASLEAELDVNLKIALNYLKSLLDMITEISEYAADEIKKLLENVPKKYPKVFDELLLEIKSELAKKSIKNSGK